MVFTRILIACVLAMSFSNSRKKSDTAAKEVMEAGYAMTAEGWFSAVSSNDVAVLRKMVAGGFDKKTKDAAGNGALHVATAFGAKEASEYLLNHGFSIAPVRSSSKKPPTAKFAPCDCAARKDKLTWTRNTIA